MKPPRVLSIVAIVVLVSMCSGCLWAPELDGVRKDIQGQLPGASFKKEFALSVGPITLGLVRTMVRLAPDTHDVREYLEDVRSVKVAVYEVENIPSDPMLKTPAKLESLVENEGWEIAAKVREDGNNVWLAYRADGESIEDLYIVALSGEELVLVRAHGNIDRLMAKAMRDHIGDSPGIPGI